MRVFNIMSQPLPPSGERQLAERQAEWRQKTRDSFWERLDAKILKGAPDECWEWQANCLPFGHGTLTVNQKPMLAHRAVHYRATGDWPEVVRHTCDNPPCCNPAHLLSGTRLDNSRDAVERGRLQRSHKGNFIISEASIDKVLELHKKAPERSFRSIARETRLSHDTVARVLKWRG